MSLLIINRLQPLTTIIMCRLLEAGTIALAGLAGSVRSGREALWDTKRFTDPLIRQSLERLRIQKLIKFETDDRNSPIILTATGLKRARHENARWKLFYNLREKRWDHLWRVVVFDIPARWKIRHAFRRELLLCGFLPLQFSVYVHPHDCRKEIEDLVDIHGLKRKVLVFTVPSIGAKERIVRQFFFNR